MYKSKKPYHYGTGRRKSSVARVHLFPNGTGSITINGRDIDDYFGLETLKLLVRQPLVTTDTVGKVDIVATGVGGGVNHIPLADDIALVCHKSGHVAHSPLIVFSSFDYESAGGSGPFVIEGNLVFLPGIGYNAHGEHHYL